MEKFLRKFREFIIGTMGEMQKCTWPKKAELFESTVVVIVTMAILTSFVFVVDFISRNLINVITK